MDLYACPSVRRVLNSQRSKVRRPPLLLDLEHRQGKPGDQKIRHNPDILIRTPDNLPFHPGIIRPHVADDP